MAAVLTLVVAGSRPLRLPLRGGGLWPASLARPAPHPVAILRHRGHGRLHDDLLLGAGALCPTVSLYLYGKDLHAQVKAHHRRRYLSVSHGPVAGGRGAISGRTTHRGCWHRAPGGWLFRIFNPK